MPKISIIGSGFVGETAGRGFMELGNEVIFYDVADKNLPNFTKDMDQAIKKTDISFICVPTPSNGEIDFSYIVDASEKLGTCLSQKDTYHVIVVKSTVVPKTTEDVVIPVIEKKSGKKVGDDIGICMNPEFMTEIANTWIDDNNEGAGAFSKNFFTEDRIVIGAYDKRSGDLIENLYKPLNKPIFRTDLKTAEMIKYANNCCLASKISFWNEIFLICNKLGIDSQNVAELVSVDPRIGKYGTVHGKAFGGKCLPKDLAAFISFAKNHHDPILLRAVEGVNKHMEKEYGVRQ